MVLRVHQDTFSFYILNVIHGQPDWIRTKREGSVPAPPEGAERIYTFKVKNCNFGCLLAPAAVMQQCLTSFSQHRRSSSIAMTHGRLVNVNIKKKKWDCGYIDMLFYETSRTGRLLNSLFKSFVLNKTFIYLYIHLHLYTLYTLKDAGLCYKVIGYFQ